MGALSRITRGWGRTTEVRGSKTCHLAPDAQGRDDVPTATLGHASGDGNAATAS